MKKFIYLSAVMLLATLTSFAQDTKSDQGKEKTQANKAPEQIRALFILDDVELPGSDLGAIKPEDIDNINVLKTAKELEPYGEKGKNGVVIITTKKHKAKKSKEGR